MNWTPYTPFSASNQQTDNRQNSSRTPALNQYTVQPPNGRVVEISNKYQGMLPTMIPDDYKSNPSLKGTLGNITARTPLSDTFFSTENQNFLQNAIRHQVWKQTGGKVVIGRQSDTELSVAMRSIFFMYSNNLPNDIQGQIRELNQQVLNQTVPIVLTNVKQYQGYLYDVQHMPMPIPHSENVSNKGSKVLPSITTTFPPSGTL